MHMSKCSNSVPSFHSLSSKGQNSISKDKTIWDTVQMDIFLLQPMYYLLFIIVAILNLWYHWKAVWDSAA